MRLRLPLLDPDGTSPARLLQVPSYYGSLQMLRARGRMAAVLSAADRKPPANDADNIALMKSFSAYTGKYTVEGDKWTTKVDVSWNEVYNSEDQVRYFKLEGHLLSVRTPEQSDVLPGKTAMFALTFARER